MILFDTITAARRTPNTKQHHSAYALARDYLYTTLNLSKAKIRTDQLIENIIASDRT